MSMERLMEWVAGGVAYFALVWLLWNWLRDARAADVTVGNILTWVRDISTSSSQLQKRYDWEIAQWSSFATAVLSATLGFISAAVIETLKKPDVFTPGGKLPVVAIGIVASLLL
jgi:hypothetical protein